MTDTDRNSPAESLARSHPHLILLHSNSEVRNRIQRLLASDHEVETTATAATARNIPYRNAPANKTPLPSSKFKIFLTGTLRKQLRTYALTG